MILLPRVWFRPLAPCLLLAIVHPVAAKDVTQSSSVNALRQQKITAPARSTGQTPAKPTVRPQPRATVAPSLKRPAVAKAPVAPEQSWLYKGSDITPDPDWKFGVLPNGLRYAVRRNGVPPGQVAVRVRIDAGSLYESDSERGFAHLIEHLSFRGSVHVPDGEAKRVWQRMGTTFGSDTNAVTTPTGTTYKLDLPAATEEGLDESLKILAGMMAQPNITSAALNAERPVVLAEQREQPGPQVRFGDALREAFFAGQPLADRSPIGNIKTLEAATAQTVAAFHDRWYRPERAVVVIVGDLDPVVFERLLAKNFQDWKGVGPNPPDPNFGKPDPAKPAATVVTEPSLPSVVSIATVRPWTYRDDTIIFNQSRLVDQLAVRMINRRLETRARGGGSYLSASVSLDDVSRSVNATVIQVLPIGADWEAAVRDVRAVIADAQAAPASQAEIDLELSEFDEAMKTAADTARAEAGAKLADDLVSAVDIRETVTTAAIAYRILQDARAKQMFTPATILASTKRVFTGDATRAIINTRAPDPTVAPRLEAALKADVSGLVGQRDALTSVTFDALPKIGPPATVVSRTAIRDLGMEKVVFSNGARLLIYANEGEANRVYVRVRFGGGMNALPTRRPSPAWAAPLALIAGGIGPFDQEALDRLTAGRRINLSFSTDEDAFVFSAITSPADMADELTLIAGKLGMPAWDPKPVARARAATLIGYDGYDSSPSGVLGHDLEGLLHGGDPRWVTPSKEQIDKTTPDAFRALWEPLLKTGPVEVQVFGDIKADDAIAAVAKSIGALPPRGIKPVNPPKVRFPRHVTTPVIRNHQGPENQAGAVIAWPTGGGIDDIAESWQLELIAQIFSDRLFDRLRSEAGASYSPSVQSNWPVGMSGGGRILGIGQVRPEQVGFFFKLSREIAADLAANPVSTDELRRTIVPFIQLLSRALSGNTFWLNQLEGATYDDRRIAALRALNSDLAKITPQILQQTAKKYFRPDRDWTMAVLPKGMTRVPDPVASPAPAPAAPPAPAGPKVYGPVLPGPR